MPTLVNLTFDVADLIGADFDARRTKVWIETNIPSGSVIDTTGKVVRLGDVKATVGTDGKGTFTGLFATNSSDLNPTGFLYQVYVDYATRADGRKLWSSGWFPLTASSDLALVSPVVGGPVNSTDDAVIASRVNDAASQTRAAIAGAIADLSARYVTPQQFGAVGDGVTNDTAAVQAAITEALAHTNPANMEKPPFAKGKNAYVFFPLGTYLVDELNVPGTIVMWGVGGGTYAMSTLRQRTAGTSILRLKADTDGTSNSSQIGHLTFDSNSDTSSPTVAQIITDVGIGTNSVYIRDCWFKTPERYAVWATQGNDIKIEGCTFDVSAYHAIRLGSGANAVTDAAVTGCTFYDVALNLIEQDNVVGLVVAGNRAFGRTASPPTTSRFLGVPSAGANTIRNVTLGANEVQRLGALATLPTLVQNLSISGGSCRDLSVCLLEITGGGVLYGLAVTGVSVFNETTGFSAGAAISGPGCGLQGSAISLNTFFSGVATALLISLSDARVQDNNLKGNARIGFTAEHNLASPTLNGF